MSINSCHSISPREKQILHLISNEQTINQIAQTLFISPFTVVTHRKNIMTKMGVKNMAGMVRVGFEAGILSIQKDSTN